MLKYRKLLTVVKNMEISIICYKESILAKVTVTKQHSWFFPFTETCTKAIAKITVTR